MSRIFASWNQLDGWLRQVERLRWWRQGLIKKTEKTPGEIVLALQRAKEVKR